MHELLKNADFWHVVCFVAVIVAGVAFIKHDLWKMLQKEKQARTSKMTKQAEKKR